MNQTANASEARGMLADAKAGALRFVNEVRADQGKPTLQNLPPGIRKDATRCPIANATGMDCDGVVLWFNDPLDAGSFLPLAVRNFTELFDRGKYPELIQEEA